MKIALCVGEAVLNRARFRWAVTRMAKLSEKIKLTLDECRMLVLGTQVMISLQFELAYQSGFESAPSIARQLVPVGLALLLCTFALLLWGPAYHRIAVDGEIRNDAQAFMTWATCVALWPLSAAMGVDAFIVSDALCGQSAAIGLGAGAFVFCCVAWYGFALLARRDRPPEVIQAMKDRDKQAEGKGNLHERVNQVLTEARVVLPGVTLSSKPVQDPQSRGSQESGIAGAAGNEAVEERNIEAEGEAAGAR